MTFFNFQSGHAETSRGSKEFSSKPGAGPNADPNLNPDGSPKYLQAVDGALVINDPTLVVFKEVGDGFPSEEELDRTYVFSNGWVPFKTHPLYAQ